MALTPVDRERIQDSKRKLQSASNTLQSLDPKKVEHLEDIQDCLDDADHSLDAALKSNGGEDPAHQRSRQT